MTNSKNILLADFKTEDEFTKNNFENLKIRYQQRIKNFRNYIKSGNNICFIINRVNSDLSALESCLNNLGIKWELKHVVINLTDEKRIKEVIDIYLTCGLEMNEIIIELNLLTEASKLTKNLA